MISQTSQPLGTYLIKGSKENLGSLQNQYDALMRPEELGFGMGGFDQVDPAVAGALKLASQRSIQNKIGGVKGQMMRNAYKDYSDRMQGYQALADSDTRRQMMEAEKAAAAKAAKKAKRKGLMGGLGSLAGTLAGAGLAYMVPGAGLAGMALGSSIGGASGGLLGQELG